MGDLTAHHSSIFILETQASAILASRGDVEIHLYDRVESLGLLWPLCNTILQAELSSGNADKLMFERSILMRSLIIRIPS